MKTLSHLVEMWEHPYTGKDDYDDTPKFHSDDAKGVVDRAKAMDEHYAKIQLDKNHLSGLHHYIASSRDMNKLLIDMHRDKISLHNVDATALPGSSYRSFHHIGHLDAAMEITGGHTPHDFNVYSGIGFAPNKIAPEINGKLHLHLPAFTSTSHAPGVAMGFSRPTKADHPGHNPHYNIMKIHIPQGSHGIQVAAHDPELSDEHEFLLARDAKLHVHPESTTYHAQHGFNSGATYKIWHAKLVHDGFKDTRHMHEDS